MSRIDRLQGTCPDCGRQQTITCYGSVNASHDPQLKTKIMSGQLFDYKCSGCGCIMSMQYPFLYHDMDLPAAVWLIPKEESVAKFDSSLRDFARMVSRNYRLRIVRSHNELIEVINIWDCGLNDLLVQLLKRSLVESNVDAARVGPWYFSEGTVTGQKKYGSSGSRVGRLRV